MSISDFIGTELGSAIILGSINVDNFIYVDDFPEPGETVLAQGGDTGLGGKGANQAVGASLLGAKVCFLGQVGMDSSADYVRKQFGNFGIDDKFLSVTREWPTGRAFITVNKAGENTICVASGANVHLSLDALGKRTVEAFDDISDGRVVALAQGETDPKATQVFAAACAERGTRFILNLAPFVDIDGETLRMANPLIVNEGEALMVLASTAGLDDGIDGVESAKAAAEKLSSLVASSVVITLGSDGAVAAEGQESWHEPSPTPARVVDTTGAGDAFVGAVVAVLARGESLREAVRWGVAAGSAAVEHLGTTDSYPTLAGLKGQMVPAAASVQL